MSTITELSEADLAFLSTYLPNTPAASSDRPFVTLTYACSLDGMISLAPGLRTTLSGPETKNMTHHLRLRHDAILVGVGTAIPDDPGLNCRYPGASLDNQPIPIVLDPHGRWNYTGSKLEALAQAGQGKTPWLIHASETESVRNAVTTADGAEHIYLPSQQPASGGKATIDWRMLLQELKLRGIASVMIEGGATVISALLETPDLVDSVVITLAPTWLGRGGVLVSPAAQTTAAGERINAARLSHTAWRQFGQDVVLCGRLQ